MDAGNMLKPMLARGEPHDRRDHARRIPQARGESTSSTQPVLVEEPSVEDTISILRGLKERYEVHHGVRITTRR